MAASMKADAGDFDTWLQSILTSFKTRAGVNVPCGKCRGCCTAGRFVHLVPSDQLAHSTILKKFLHRAPGMPKGHALMGYLDGGICPMLKSGDCSIYPSRPSTCRTFDCRVLAAPQSYAGHRHVYLLEAGYASDRANLSEGLYPGVALPAIMLHFIPD